jgi:hypothetical protein
LTPRTTLAQDDLREGVSIMAKSASTQTRPADLSKEVPAVKPNGQPQRALRSADAEAAPHEWSPLARGVASGLILFHLAAVIIAAVVAAPPYSDLSRGVAKAFRGYINAADLNHGYRFFAPDPSPSHLVRYHLEFADGSKRDGHFPDLADQWPRLLYHRYFMLSEHLYAWFAQWQEALENSKAPIPLAMRQKAVDDSHKAEGLYRAFAQSFASELLRRNGAARVTLELVEHAIPPLDDVARGQALNDDKSYRVVDTLGPFGEGGVPEELP